MNGNHLDEDLLTTYAIDPALVPGRAELEAHLPECGRVRGPARRHPRVRRAPRRRDLLARGREARAPAGPAGDGRAGPVRGGERRAPPRALARRLAGRVRVRGSDVGCAVVHGGGGAKLAEAAEKAWYSNPRHALNLAETAITIGGKLSPVRYTAEELAAAKGTAWKQKANALRHLGRFVDAREALDHAEFFFEQLALPELDLASVKYIRATTYNEQQQYDLAERYAAESTVAFQRIGQTDLYLASRLLEGFIAFERRELVRAQQIWEPIRAHGEAKGDAHWIGLSTLALGNCALERGDLASATQLLHAALPHFRKLGITAGEVRCRWALAMVTRRGGRPRAAVRQYRAVRDEFLLLGAVTDAALVTLDLMETLLELGMTRDVQRAAGDVVSLFNEHGMLTGAVTAADYLKRAAATRSVTPGIIDYVRKYLRRVEAEPDFAFLAPAPL